MNDMRKLIETVEKLNEYGTPPPGNYIETTATGDEWEEIGGDLFSVDWKDSPEETLIMVANALLKFGLRVEVIDFSDDQYHFKIVK